jgi:hypothetical protein
MDTEDPNYSEFMLRILACAPSDLWPLTHGRYVVWIEGRPYAIAMNEGLTSIAREFGIHVHDLLMVNSALYPDLRVKSHLRRGTLVLLPWLVSSSSILSSEEQQKMSQEFKYSKNKKRPSPSSLSSSSSSSSPSSSKAKRPSKRSTHQRSIATGAVKAGAQSISSNGRQSRSVLAASRSLSAAAKHAGATTLLSDTKGCISYHNGASAHFQEDGPRRIIEESLANSGWLKIVREELCSPFASPTVQREPVSA